MLWGMSKKVLADSNKFKKLQKKYGDTKNYGL